MKLGSLMLNGPAKSTFAIGGHRGCGENLLAVQSPAVQQVEPALRENTIASFKRAASLGVSFVEFDVQVTKDGTPVIWHDDQILTRRPGSPIPAAAKVADKVLGDFKSLVQSTEDGEKWVTDVVRAFRSRETRQAVGGLTAWQCSQDDALPTLQQVFQELPESVGFDIEVKMTLPDDIVMTPPEEIQRVVPPILSCVEAATGGYTSARTIMYSSFDPDVCVEIAKRQTRYPVMFLSGCGLYPHVDARRTSLSAALDFATLHQLAGVVLPASIVIANPELVLAATSSGLKVLTYGLENDDVSVVQKQMELGVHAAIVDDVERTLPKLISKTDA